MSDICLRRDFKVFVSFEALDKAAEIPLSLFEQLNKKERQFIMNGTLRNLFVKKVWTLGFF